MTDCLVVEPLLSAWLDGELDSAVGTSVGLHLAGCDACRSELDTLKLLRGRLRSLPARQLPPDIRDRVPAAASAGPGSRLPRSARMSALIGLVLALLLLLSSIGTTGPPPRTIAVPAEVWLTDQGLRTPAPAGVTPVSAGRR